MKDAIFGGIYRKRIVILLKVYDNRKKLDFEGGNAISSCSHK